MTKNDRQLTVEQAARLIYNAKVVSTEQIDRVKTKIDKGALQRGPRGGYTTTANSVADYMAARVAATNANGHKHARGFKPGEKLPGLYQDLLKDYFLAVLLQRTARKRSRIFGALVIAFQIGIIATPLLALASTYRSSIAAMVKSPQRAAAEKWLDEQYDDFEISSWAPVADTEEVQVGFWYSKKGTKRVETVRIFQIDYDQVTAVRMPE